MGQGNCSGRQSRKNVTGRRAIRDAVVSYASPSASPCRRASESNPSSERYSIKGVREQREKCESFLCDFLIKILFIEEALRGPLAYVCRRNSVERVAKEIADTPAIR